MKRFEEEFEELWNAEREAWPAKPAHQDVVGETDSQDDLGLGGRGTQPSAVAGVSSASVTDTATRPSGTGVVIRTGDDPDRGHDEVDGLDLRRHEQCGAGAHTAGSSVVAVTSVATGSGLVQAETGVATGTANGLDWVISDGEDTEVNVQRRRRATAVVDRTCS